MIKTVLFDLDGTLIQSTELIIESYVETMKKMVPTLHLTEEEKTNFLGQTLKSAFSKHFEHDIQVEEAIHQYRAISKQKNKTQLKAYPNAIEVIRYFKRHQRLVGIVTSKSKAVCEENLKQLQMDHLFDVIIVMEDVLEHKPSPEGLILAMQRLNATPEETIYIGDHENDIIAAKHAKIESCAVTYSKRLKQMLSYQPEYVIDELKQLKDII